MVPLPINHRPPHSHTHTLTHWGAFSRAGGLAGLAVVVALMVGLGENVGSDLESAHGLEADSKLVVHELLTDRAISL